MATNDPMFGPDVIEAQQLQQKQAMAQALMQQGMQNNGGVQMVGPVAVGQHPVAGMANMLGAYLGGKMNRDATQQLGQLSEQQRQRTAAILQKGFEQGKSGDTWGAIQTLASDKSTQPFAEQILKSQMAPSGNKSSLTPTYFKDKDGKVHAYQLHSSGGGSEVDAGGMEPILPTANLNMGNAAYVVDRSGRVVAGGEKGIDPNNIYNQSQQTQRQENEPLIAAKTDAGKSAIQQSDAAIKSLATIKSTIANIDDAIKAIDSGANTGVIAARLPSIQRASIELDNARSRLGLNVVQGTTFGALSEGELRLALDTALPTNLQPQDLKEWLLAKKSAQQKLAAQLEDAAIYLGQPGHTPAQYLESKRGANPVTDKRPPLSSFGGK